MPELTSWVAKLTNGEEILRGEADRMKEITPGAVKSFTVLTNHPKVPEVRVELDPKKGGIARAFTRHMRAWNGLGSKSMVVVQVEPDPAEPDRWVRIYILPDGRMVVSTEDLYL